MPTHRAVAPTLVLLLGLACSGDATEGFSPLIRAGSAGRYDLTLEGISSIRSAELAPGAAPARPKIEGRRAEKTIHFIATYAGDADPEVIGDETIEALESAAFLEVTKVYRQPSESGFSATLGYTTDKGKGTVQLGLAPTEQPNRLELTYRVEERLR